MSGELLQELLEAEEALSRFARALIRQERGEICPSDEHIRRCRQSMMTVGGFEEFKQRVNNLTGLELIHGGYHVYECIACGQWSLDDYCGDQLGEITPEAAEQLL